jgi:hypothetical protein
MIIVLSYVTAVFSVFALIPALIMEYAWAQHQADMKWLAR